MFFAPTLGIVRNLFLRGLSNVGEIETSRDI